MFCLKYFRFFSSRGQRSCDTNHIGETHWKTIFWFIHLAYARTHTHTLNVYEKCFISFAMCDLCDFRSMEIVTEKNLAEQQRSVVGFYDFWYPRGRRKVFSRCRQMSTARRNALHTDHRSPSLRETNDRYSWNFIQGRAGVYPERYLQEEVFSYALIYPNSRSRFVHLI